MAATYVPAMPPWTGIIVNPRVQGWDHEGPFVSISLADHKESGGVDIMTDADGCGFIWRFERIVGRISKLARYRPALRDEP